MIYSYYEFWGGRTNSPSYAYVGPTFNHRLHSDENQKSGTMPGKEFPKFKLFHDETSKIAKYLYVLPISSLKLHPVYCNSTCINWKVNTLLGDRLQRNRRSSFWQPWHHQPHSIWILWFEKLLSYFPMLCRAPVQPSLETLCVSPIPSLTVG